MTPETTHLARELDLVVYLDGQQVGLCRARPFWTLNVTESHMVPVFAAGGPVPHSTLLQLEFMPLMVEPNGWVLARAQLRVDQQTPGELSAVRFRALAGATDEAPTGVVRSVFPRYEHDKAGRYQRLGDVVFHCTIRSLG